MAKLLFIVCKLPVMRQVKKLRSLLANLTLTSNYYSEIKLVSFWAMTKIEDVINDDKFCQRVLIHIMEIPW